MKNKFTIAVVTMSLFTGYTAFSQEDLKGENFTKHKAEIIANLNQEKVIIDQEISCISSAQKREDGEKCRNQKQSSMQQSQQQRIAKRKEHLQGQLKKLDEESAKASQKDNKTNK